MVTNKDSVRVEAEFVAEEESMDTLAPQGMEELDIDELWEEAVSETDALKHKLQEEPEALEAELDAVADQETALDSFDDRWIDLEDVPLETPVADAEPELVVDPAAEAEPQPVAATPFVPAPVMATKEGDVPQPFKYEEKKGSERQGSGMLGWFLGAALAGAVLGAIIMGLVLSSINGGLSYVSTTSGVQLLQEQARLSGDITELTRDLVAVENELANLSGLPAEMVTLSGDMTALRRDLGTTIIGLEELGLSLNDVSQDLSTLDGEVVSLSTSLGELAVEAETLREQATAIEATVGELGTSVDQMGEQLGVLAESKAKFDGFIDGLRALVGE